MKTVYLYYSYTGRTEKLAQSSAKKAGAPFYEIKTAKKLGKFKAYTLGSFGAIRGAAAKLEPLKANLSVFDKIVVMGPIWAGKPAPAVNGILDQIPGGKEIEVRAVSGSGKSNAKAAVEKRLQGKGAKSITVVDLKG